MRLIHSLLIAGICPLACLAQFDSAITGIDIPRFTGDIEAAKAIDTLNSESEIETLKVESVFIPSNCDNAPIEDAGNVVWDERDSELTDPYNPKAIKEREERLKNQRVHGKSKLGDILIIHYTGYIDESSKVGTPGSLVDTTYHYFKREHRHDALGHKHSKRAGTPFEFTLGKEEGHKLALKAFHEGLLDMCVGERRLLIIPPNLGFGPVGTGPHTVRRSFPPVPGGVTLKYVVHLVAVRRPTPAEVALTSEGDFTSGQISPDMEDAYKKMLEGQPVGRNIFAEIDLDRDERISHEELMQWYIGHHKRIREEDPEEKDPRTGKKRTHKVPRTLPNRFWDSQDKDKDGYISWKEFPGPKGTKQDPFKTDL